MGYKSKGNHPTCYTKKNWDKIDWSDGKSKSKKKTKKKATKKRGKTK